MWQEKESGINIQRNLSFCLLKKSIGNQAIALYEKSGRTAQEWQVRLLQNIMAVRDDGLWVHTKFGYSIPRHNGKNEIIAHRPK